MAYNRTISLNDAQHQFIKDRGLSPSLILQESINRMVEELDPELYQSQIKEFTRKGEDKHMTKWQKLQDYYRGEPRKREFAMLLFGHALGQDIDEDVQKLRLSSKDMHEVQERLKGYENGGL